MLPSACGTLSFVDLTVAFNWQPSGRKKNVPRSPDGNNTDVLIDNPVAEYTDDVKTNGTVQSAIGIRHS
jgi:hypothetical protein